MDATIWRVFFQKLIIMALVPIVFWIISSIVWEIIYKLYIKRTLQKLDLKSDEKIDEPNKSNKDLKHVLHNDVQYQLN